MTSSSSADYAPWVRITGIVIVALVVATAAIFLGRWQWHRYEVRAEALAQYEAGQLQDPAPLNELVAPGSTDLPDDAQWREAVLVGRFDADSTTVLRNRPVDSTPSWQYLAWFDTTDGRSMLVNLGWIPLPGPNGDPAVPVYPTEETTVTVIVREWEEDDGRRGEGANRITPEQAPTPASEPVPGYGMLREVCASGECSPTLVGEQTPLPALSTGPHLSYAWQWWVLAAMVPVGVVILIRRDRLEAEPTSDSESPVPAPPVKQRKRRLSDEEIEDAL